MVPSQKKRNSQIFFLQSPVARRYCSSIVFDAGTQDGLPFTCPGDLVARGTASHWQIMDSALIVSLDVDDRDKAVPAAKSFVL